MTPVEYQNRGQYPPRVRPSGARGPGPPSPMPVAPGVFREAAEDSTRAACVPRRCFPTFIVVALVLAPLCIANAASPGDAPPLPITGARIVNVASEPQLQSAMGNLQNGDTLLLADGTYNLTASLYINGRHNITIRGNAGSTNVILAGQGMDNSGGVPFGIWSNGTNTTIAHLTIRDTWDNEIIFNPGAQSPRVYCVRLINAGSQFIKSNPTDV